MQAHVMYVGHLLILRVAVALPPCRQEQRLGLCHQVCTWQLKAPGLQDLRRREEEEEEENKRASELYQYRTVLPLCTLRRSVVA